MTRRCWCGRTIAPDSMSTCGCCCTEHDTPPLPARLSPRPIRTLAGRLLEHLRAAGLAAFWPAVAGAGLLLGLFVLFATRGQYAAWDGFHPIPTGGIR